MTAEEKQKLLTTGSVKDAILKLSVPCIVSMTVTSVYNMADSYFVSSMGSGAIGAVGVVFSLMAIIQAVGFFFGHGSGNYISRKIGNNSYDDATEMAAAGYYLSFFTGIIITIIGFIFIDPLARLLGSDDVILPYAKIYLTYILIGAPFMCSSLTMNNQLRFQGNAFYSMIGMGTGALVNIFGDFILVRYIGMHGAGLSTLLSQMLSFVLLRIGIIKSTNVKIHFKNFHITKNIILNIMNGGMPSLVRQSIGSIATILLNQICKGYGTDVIAAMSVVTRITHVPWSIITGIGQGFQPVCGYNYGAKKYGRVKEGYYFTMFLSGTVMAAMCVLCYAFAPQLISLFTKASDKITDFELFNSFGISTLRLHLIFLPLPGLYTAGNMMLQTMGKSYRASLLAVARQGLFFIPLLLIIGGSIEMLKWVQPISDICTAVLTFVLVATVFKELKE